MAWLAAAVCESFCLIQLALSSLSGFAQVSHSAALPRPPAPQRPAVLYLHRASLTQPPSLPPSITLLPTYGSCSPNLPVDLQRE